MPIDNLELARRIDRLCREFEQKWRGPDQPSIEDLLERVDVDGREPLLIELIALERELLARRGGSADPEDYHARFPRLARAVDRGFESSVHVAPPPAPDPFEAPTIPPARMAELPETEAVTLPLRDGPGPQETAYHPSGLPPQETIEDGQTTDFRGPGQESDPSIGTVRHFGDYELLKEIARGGMGVVYRARQVSLNRPVALKMILAGQLAGEADIKRFHIEAEAAANLDHPGIVPVHEVGRHDNQHYFSMGFIEGQSLGQKLAAGPLPARETAELFLKIAEAVDYAHRRGVIHRDLKPANILIDGDGSPKVTDFGLAKRIEGRSDLTGPGQIMGTPSYMAPEQAAASKDLTTSVDVYGIGATLYEALAGRPPFRGSSPLQTLIEVLESPPVPPRSLVAGADRGLELICLKCLEKDPARRYSSALELAGDLRRWLQDEPLSVRPPGLIE